MNWEAISAVGEIVGATAVVVTLIYLAVQVRHGTRATQAASIHAASALDQEFLMKIGESPETATLWVAYLTDPQSLPDDQLMQGHYLFGAVFRRLENIYHQHELGTLSERGWQSRQSLLTGLARTRGFVVFQDSPPAVFLKGQFMQYMTRLSAHK